MIQNFYLAFEYKDGNGTYHHSCEITTVHPLKYAHFYRKFWAEAITIVFWKELTPNEYDIAKAFSAYPMHLMEQHMKKHGYM